MDKIKILLNATNARNVGGGLQVVVNLIKGTLNYPRDGVEWVYAVSECLDQKYLTEEFKAQVKGRYHVFPNQPDFFGTFRKVQKSLNEIIKSNGVDLVFTPLAPSYQSFKVPEVIRYANGWPVASNKYAWKTLTFKARLRMYLHNALTRKILRHKPYVITQTDNIKRNLIAKTDHKDENVRVVNNVLPASFKGAENKHIEHKEGVVEIVSVGDGPHKNLEIVPDVLEILNGDKSLPTCRIHLTLPEASPILATVRSRARKLGCEEQIVNHERLPHKELAQLYRQCDICFLPTILEVFSASILEAMYFQLPTVATNFSFNTEVFRKSCLYFEPTNAGDAAEKLAQLIKDTELQGRLRQTMTQELKRFSSFDKYFNDTVDFLVEISQRNRLK